MSDELRDAGDSATFDWAAAGYRPDRSRDLLADWLSRRGWQGLEPADDVVVIPFGQDQLETAIVAWHSSHGCGGVTLQLHDGDEVHDDDLAAAAMACNEWNIAARATTATVQGSAGEPQEIVITGWLPVRDSTTQADFDAAADVAVADFLSFRDRRRAGSGRSSSR